jgi:hypothetical protein
VNLLPPASRLVDMSLEEEAKPIHPIKQSSRGVSIQKERD